MKKKAPLELDIMAGLVHDYLNQSVADRFNKDLVRAIRLVDGWGP